jgi:hypothetical protein
LFVDFNCLDKQKIGGLFVIISLFIFYHANQVEVNLMMMMMIDINRSLDAICVTFI